MTRSLPTNFDRPMDSKLLKHPKQPNRTPQALPDNPKHKADTDFRITKEWLQKVITLPGMKTYAQVILQGKKPLRDPNEHHDITEIKNGLKKAIRDSELRAHLILLLQDEIPVDIPQDINDTPSKAPLEKSKGRFNLWYILIIPLIIGLFFLVKGVDRK